jgi:hypothetical protein
MDQPAANGRGRVHPESADIRERLMNPFRSLLVWSLVSILAVSSSAAAQQPNTPTASAVWGGTNGPTWPIGVTATPSVPLTFAVSGFPFQPYLLAHAPAGLAAGAIPTPFGIVDLDLSLGLDFVLNGFGGTAPLDFFATTGPTGTSSWSFNLSPSMVGSLGGFQTLVGDPTSPGGYKLSAATSINVVPVQVFYVSSTTGAPGNPGTMAAPVQTISQALALAAAAAPAWVRVASGTYAESPTFQSGVTVFGGLDPVTWLSSPAPSVIQVSAGGAVIAASASPHLQSLAFQAPNATGPGASSIAMRVLAGAAPTFSVCTFTAGSGAAGSAGPNGTAGANGSAGGAGDTGWNYTPSGAGGSAGIGGLSGGVGGTGGWQISNGSVGSPGSGPSGGPGGFPGGYTTCGGGFTGPGGPGVPGGDGSPGAGGVAAGAGTLTGAGAFLPGNGGSGAAGAHGSGGGGGGGGGGTANFVPSCNPANGGGGGGGGGGGFGGAPGTGGGGGGASFGVAILSASPAFLACTFNTGNGGTGGTGGNGAVGGAGGAPGPGGYGANVTFGGPGGAGGAGGSSGGASGGSGGPSCGIARSASSVVSTSGCTFNVGSPGSGGAGGTAPSGAGAGVNGPSGLSGQIVQFN